MNKLSWPGKRAPRLIETFRRVVNAVWILTLVPLKRRFGEELGNALLADDGRAVRLPQQGRQRERPQGYSTAPQRGTRAISVLS